MSKLIKLKLEAHEQMNVVVIGHVDHGKSTVVGRLLADTGSLPKGKLEAVKATCEKNARPFEYAFLLDALKNEQAQGITIDAARCFFQSEHREYIIIDAPGHIEFLKNMISGAARAEAALLVIDAHEGVQENSRRHGYLLSMLGIRQFAIGVNKMDLVEYKQEVFEKIRNEYKAFLKEIGVEARSFIPISAREGENIVVRSEKMPWYEGPSVLQMFDSFTKEASKENMPLRFPVQDIYKFTEQNDNRRIFAGRIETGKVSVGDSVIFLPSKKESKIKSIEGFNGPVKTAAIAGESTGLQLETQVYLKPGEIMCKTNELEPKVSSRFKVNIFWMGRQPMIQNKPYKLKLAGARATIWLHDIHNVLDASNLTTDTNKNRIDRHDVAECTLETVKPIAFDLNQTISQTGRFVIIDNYEIAGGGVVLESVLAIKTRYHEHVERREKLWDHSSIRTNDREARYNQKATLVVLSGPTGSGKVRLAKALEENLFSEGRSVYYLGISNNLTNGNADGSKLGERDEFIFRLGEVAYMFTDAGIILITTVSDIDGFELQNIKTLNHPNDCLVINVGENRLDPGSVDLQVDHIEDLGAVVGKVKELLQDKKYFSNYSI